MSYPGGGQWPGQQQPDPYSGQPIYGYQPPQHGYQQPPPYGYPQQPGPGYGMPPGPPKKSRGPVIAAVVLVLLLLAGGGVGAYFFFIRDDKNTDQAGGQNPAPAPAPSSSVPPSTSPSTQPSTDPPAPDDARIKATTSGYQGVWSYKDKVAYDLPKSKDWEVETPGTIAGFENKDGPTATMRGVSTFKDNYCPKAGSGWHRGRVGTQKAGDIAPEKAATRGVEIWASAAAEKELTNAPKAETVRIAGGKVSAKMAKTTVTFPKSATKECAKSGQKMKLWVVAFKPEGSGDTIVLIAYTETGVADEVSGATVSKIIKSFRPHAG